VCDELPAKNDGHQTIVIITIPAAMPQFPKKSMEGKFRFKSQMTLPCIFYTLRYFISLHHDIFFPQGTSFFIFEPIETELFLGPHLRFETGVVSLS
jgi:hypothetical protein